MENRLLSVLKSRGLEGVALSERAVQKLGLPDRDLRRLFEGLASAGLVTHDTVRGRYYVTKAGANKKKMKPGARPGRFSGVLGQRLNERESRVVGALLASGTSVRRDVLLRQTKVKAKTLDGLTDRNILQVTGPGRIALSRDAYRELVGR